MTKTIREILKEFDDKFVKMTDLRIVNLNNELYVNGKVEEVKDFICHAIEQAFEATKVLTFDDIPSGKEWKYHRGHEQACKEVAAAQKLFLEGK